jgi:mono-ADP-ribosyltransferase sirtuin 6
VWTHEEKKMPPPEGIEFAMAQPSFTHLALAALVKEGFVEYIISQNVDG